MDALNKIGKKQKGIATLEFWLTAPFLLLVVFAVSELGWAFSQYHTMTRATRDGARHVSSLAMNGSIGLILLDSNLVQQTSNLVVYGNTLGAGDPLLPGWSAGDITVTKPDAAHVTVSATYNYIPLIGQIPAFYGGEPISMAFEMQSTVQMRAL
ncbi:TadE-like protein [Marinobacter pelagius]|uniref:TadE-like protein n=1 Tax=Marinobacter pelagius TaxID=379482 RepID=A0A366GZ98_9GAMM|nr:TadE family protein [Marinobacter pelagius]RBP34036.1 TadE-like protein [Marinobacter pelagius]